jgi:hypothetical protein
VASKKCPKCGEDNPAEAVMCWACYTPLAGSAPIPVAGAARAGAGGVAGKGGPVGAPTQEDGEKKQLDPKLFVVGGLLLLGIIVAVVMNMGGSGGSDDSTPMGQDPGTTSMSPDPGGGGAPPPPAPVAPPSFAGQSNTPVEPVALPYNVIVPPNAKYATGTMGILATQANITPNQARGLAKFAHDQFSRNGKWSKMQIAVFSDAGAARTFATYQSRRRGAPMTANDYRELANSNVWSGAPAFYESSGKRESIAYPASNPMNWWTRSGG